MRDSIVRRGILLFNEERENVNVDSRSRYMMNELVRGIKEEIKKKQMTDPDVTFPFRQVILIRSLCPSWRQSFM